MKRDIRNSMKKQFKQVKRSKGDLTKIGLKGLSINSSFYLSDKDDGEQ